jgi:hypothetical protein
MRKRAPTGEEPVPAKCFECGARYRLISVGDKQVRWEPQQSRVYCPTDGCSHTFVIGDHEVELGASWTCPNCCERWTVCYGITMDTSPKV